MRRTEELDFKDITSLRVIYPSAARARYFDFYERIPFRNRKH